MERPLFTLAKGNSPLVATAIHDGHAVRKDVEDLLAIGEAERLREEDPYTGRMTDFADTRVIVQRSRFEVDLNRARDKAVYLSPEDAWGLQVWRELPPLPMLEKSLREYDTFHMEMRSLLQELVDGFGRFVVYDVHTYNHRRSGANEPPEDPEKNPEVNIGTGWMERGRWASLVDRFITDLRSFDFFGRSLDVRENVKFRGGNFSRWIHESFPKSGCCLAIEIKKFFTDEWTGKADPEQIAAISRALHATTKGVLEELAGSRSGAFA